jgi:hypothetical protein
LANALSNQGKDAEAEKEYRNVLAGYSKVLGSAHHDALSARHNLASVALPPK